MSIDSDGVLDDEAAFEAGEALLVATTRRLELGYYHASMDLALCGPGGAPRGVRRRDPASRCGGRYGRLARG